MRAGLFVGRVGGLAVALGVGVAVASNPGVAWADDTESASSEASAGSAGTGTGGTSESQGTSTTVGTTAGPADTPTAAGTETGASTSGAGSLNTSESGTSAATGASVRQVPPGIAMSTGGADSSTKSNSETSASGDVSAELTTDESTLSKPVADATARGGSKKQRQRVNDSTGVQRVEADMLTATRKGVPSLPEISPPPRTVVDVAVQRPAAQQPVTAVNARTYLPPQANFVAQAISAARSKPTEPPSTVAAVVLAALATAGLGPLASPNGPLTPVDSPLELALLAVDARARPFGQLAIEETRSQPVDSALTGQSVEGAQTFAAAAMVVAVNSAPNVPVQPVGTPDPVTGVVTGTVIATDPDNNTLTYTVAGGPTKGTVQLNSQTGAYTYTPTQAARLAAGATASADTDSFTVSVSDGQQTTTASVSVFVSPTRFENKAPIAVGTNPSAVVVSGDGRMYVANTGSGTVSVINTATGSRIDANSSIFSTDISVGSSPSALALSADGKRLYVANTGSGTVSVIDTTTYNRIDANPNIFSKDISVGTSPSALEFGPDGRLYVANRGSNTVSVIDTSTNKLVDTNPNITGTQSISVGAAPSALALSGTQLYVANRSSNTVSVINTTTYSVTTTITVGSQPSSVALGPDGRLYVANTGSGTVSVINTVTNTAIDTDPNAVGTNSISVGPSPSSVAFNPTGGLAYVANANDTVSVIDTATYRVVSTVAIDSDTTGGHVVAVSPNGTIYVTDAADKTVRVLTITRGNTAPIAGTPTVGTANTDTGAVSGALNFTDADGDTLSYSLTQPSTGTVSITSAGVYTFTPAQAARAAAAAGGPTSTTFTVNATDGQATAAKSLTVPIAPAVLAPGVTVIGNITLTGTLTGYPSGSPVVSADRTRALITTDVGNSTTRVAVINPTTGTQIGSTLTLTGTTLTPYDSTYPPVMSADGTRALITTTTNSTTGTTTRVAVINTTTGAQTGTTLTLTGEPSVNLALSADGSRALITTRAYDPAAGNYTTRVAVINTAAGTQTGTTVTLTGDPSTPLFSADGTRAVITTTPYIYDPATNATRVAVIDTITGAQTGTTFTLPGLLSGSPVLSANGTRALITTYVDDSATGTSTSRVAVINTTTGTQTGATITLTGSPTWLQLSADGTRALITTTTSPGVYDPATNATRVAVIYTTTGTQTGTTLTITGEPSASLFSADGTRALITTAIYDPATQTDTTRVAVINTTTGTQTGTTLTITGAPYASGLQRLSANGTRALITTYTYDSATGIYTTWVAVINTTTGTQTGTTLTLTGSQFPTSALLSSDGTRAVMITTTDAAFGGTTRASVIDTTTGAQIGTTLTLTGEPVWPVLSADGTRAVITTYATDNATGITTTRVAVINTSTGTQTGSTFTLTGVPMGTSVLLSADGTRALIKTNVNDTATGTYTTRVALINTTTGTQTGTTLTLTGEPLWPVMSADGSRALITTVTYDSATRTYITRETVISTATGTQTGTTLTFTGVPSGPPVLSADGSRALITTDANGTTRVAVLQIV